VVGADPDSGGSDCPALYRTNRHSYLVVGTRVTDAELLAQITLGITEDEVVVEVPQAVLDLLTTGRPRPLILSQAGSGRKAV